jgi:hypothetical protein
MAPKSLRMMAPGGRISLNDVGQRRSFECKVKIIHLIFPKNSGQSHMKIIHLTLPIFTQLNL